MRLSIPTKIGVLLALVFVVLMIQYQRFVTSNSRELKLVHEMSTQTLTDFYSTVMELDRERLRILAYDYSFWDDMVRFVQTGDSAWAYDNLETAIATYDADFAAVFRTDGSLVYAASKDSQSKLARPDSLFHKHSESQSFAHFHKVDSGRFLEVWQAPIQPSKDNARSTEPQGYFFCGRILNPQYLTRLADLVDANLDLVADNPLWNDRKESHLSEGLITYSQPLLNCDGQIISQIVFQNRTPVLSSIWRSNFYEPITFLLISIILLGTCAYLVVMWFKRPIQALALAIDTPDTTVLNSFQTDTGEIGQLARAIIRSHKQRDEIIEGRRRLMTLFTALPGMAYRCMNDPKWTVEFVSEGCFDLTGYQSDEIISNRVKTYADLIVEVDRVKVWDDVQLALSKKERFLLTYRIIKKSGEERWVSERGQGVWDENDKLVALEGFIHDITRQVNAEQAIRKSEEEYRELVEKANNAIIKVNAEGIVTFANEPALRMFGFSREDLVGVSVLKTIMGSNEKSIEDEREAVKKALELKGSISIIQQNIKKDGLKIWVAWSHSAIKDDAGKIIGVMAIGTDVTAQKTAEESLSASEGRFRQVFDNAPDAFYIHDLDGLIIDANKAAEKLFGKSIEKLIGFSILEFAPGDEKAYYTMMEILTHGYAGKPKAVSEIRLKRADGRIFDAELNAIPVELGGRQCILGMARDVTIRKQGEKAIRQSEEQYRAVVSQSSDGIILVEADSGRLLKVNIAFVALTGYKEIDALSLTLYDLIAEPGAAIAGMLSHSALSGHYDCGEQKLLRADGSNIAVEVRGDLIQYGDRKAISILIHDITERLTSELALRASEERYRLLFRSSPLGVFHYDLELKITDCNEQLANILGSTRQEILGFDLSLIHDTRVLPAIKAPLDDETGSYEGTYVSNLGGIESHVSLHTSPIKSSNGDIIGALGIVEDISLRMTTIAALTKSEERFRSLVGSMDDIVYTLDRDERYTGLYGKWVERFRLEPDQMLGKTVLEVFGPVDGLVHHEANLRALTGELTIYESFHRQNDREIPIQTSLSPIYGEDGAIVGLVGIGRDVSQLKKYESDLRRHTEQLQALYDGARVLGSTLDLVIIYQKLHDIIRQVAPCDGLFISSFDAETNLITCEYAWHEGALIDVTKLPPIPLEERGKGIQSEVIRSGESLMIGDFQARARTGEVNLFVDDSGSTYTEIDDEAEVTRSAIIVPIRFDSAIIGVIQVLSYNRNAYTDENLHLVESLTSHAAAAHKNGLLYRRAQEEIAERARAEKLQSALWRIAQSAAEMTDDTLLFPRIHEIIREVIPAQNFYIALYDKEEDLIRFPFYVEEVEVTPPPRKPRKGLTEYTLNRKDAYLWRSDQEDPTVGGEICIEGNAPKVWLGVPLLEGEKTFGVMAVQHFTDPNSYGQRERQVLEFVGSEVARSISHLRANMALAESEMKYRSLIENSEDGIYLLVEERFEIYNRRFMEMLKISESEIAAPGFSMFELVAAESRPLIEARSAMIERGENPPPRYEFTALRKDGSEIEVEVSVAQLMYRGKRATQGILRDITGRRLLESQMRQTQKLEAIGRLAGGVAHDFNNLLTAIIGTSELLKRQVADRPELTEELDQILAVATRGSNLTQQLLAFSRSKPHQARPMKLSGSVEHMERMLKRLIGEDIKLITKLTPELPTVIADPAQIELALMNLVINARDAMPNGGTISIETSTVFLDEHYISLHPDVMPGGYCVLTVSDRGVGMSMETLERATEPFFTTKPVGQGTGLGLSTVHGIVKQSGGHLSIESEVGHGTTVKIFLPQSVANEEVPVIEGKQETEELTGCETILVVDDEDSVRNVTVRILQLQGYMVIEAIDGVEALQIVDQYSGDIHLLLSDMMMPRLGGIELATKMMETRPSLKVLLMSGYSPKAYPSDDSVNAHLFEFIQKPFRATELASKVRDLLNTRT